MADPSMAKVPIVESVPEPGNMTPATNSPALSAVRPTGIPIYQETVHRPPPSTVPSEDPSEPDDDYKTININITIKVPSSFRFPCFHRCKRRDGGPGGRTYRGMRTGIPVEEKRRRFVAVLIGLFYISFIVCASVAWHLRNHYYLNSIPVAPLVLETFMPFLDLFVLLSTIFVIRRHQENDKPAFKYFILILINFGLFVLHLVCLIMAATWVNTNSGSYYYWYGNRKKPVIAALILYNTATLILFKIIILLAILKSRSLRDKFGQSVSRIPAMIGEEYRYQALTRDVDDDASGIDSARNSTEQHGRVFLA